MKKLLMISAIAIILLIGISIAIEVTNIKPTDLAFKPRATVSQTTQNQLRNLTISDIICNEKDICRFAIMKGTRPIAVQTFNATKMDEKQIIAERDKLIIKSLSKWIHEQEANKQPTSTNIGGSGNITIIK